VTELTFDAELIRRYDKAGPRYTSYPTALQFHQEFTADTYREIALASNQSARPLSLYFHLPFCDTICYYCACNKVVTKDRARAVPYLEALHKEIELQAEVFDRTRAVTQLHWGGGTPTFISHQQMRDLMQHTRKHFNLVEDDAGEFSIEIDPREANTETIKLLREIGFNRLSMGVQDFDPAVQKAVNRIQSEQETVDVIQAARDCGFYSISLDLIYGLPHQTEQSFANTLARVIELSPDRISVFNYAHLPELFKPQRRINVEDLPGPAEKLAILHQSIDKLTDAGYVYIGMDHFAKPDDELALAQANGSLYRNFQGYSTHADCDMVAMGITSIGMVANSYSQNVKTTDEYYQHIKQNQLPVFRGIELNDDDVLRRFVITELICNFVLDINRTEQAYQITFTEYFAKELQALQQMQADGLLEVTAGYIRVQPVGKLLIRNICMVFDHYLQQQAEKQFSRVI